MISLILELAGGDLRKAITYLQTAQRLHSSIEPPTPVSALSSMCFFSSLYRSSGLVPGGTVQKLRRRS